MEVRAARATDLDAWAALRHALWPDCPLGTAREEAETILASDDENAWLLWDGDAAVGFAEAQVHDGGASGPYAHVEGWFVDPAYRGCGHGQELLGHLEPWCLHRGITRLTSDTTKDYPLSPAAHARAGFRTLHRFTIFVKDLTAGREG